MNKIFYRSTDASKLAHDKQLKVDVAMFIPVFDENQELSIGDNPDLGGAIACKVVDGVKQIFIHQGGDIWQAVNDSIKSWDGKTSINQFRSNSVGGVEYLFRSLVDSNEFEPLLIPEQGAWTKTGAQYIIPAWNSIASYIDGGYVERSGTVFRSKTSDNENNDPLIDFTHIYWQQIGANRGYFDANGIYDAGDVVVDDEDGNRIYVSNIGANEQPLSDDGSSTWQVIGVVINDAKTSSLTETWSVDKITSHVSATSEYIVAQIDEASQIEADLRQSAIAAESDRAIDAEAALSETDTYLLSELILKANAADVNSPVFITSEHVIAGKYTNLSYADLKAKMDYMTSNWPWFTELEFNSIGEANIPDDIIALIAESPESFKGFISGSKQALPPEFDASKFTIDADGRFFIHNGMYVGLSATRQGEFSFKQSIRSFVDNFNRAKSRLNLSSSDVYGAYNPPTLNDIQNLGLKKGDTYICTSDGVSTGTEIQRAIYNGTKLSSWKIPRPYSSFPNIRESVDTIIDAGFNHIEVIASRKLQKTIKSMTGFLHINDVNQINGYVTDLKARFIRLGSSIKDNATLRTSVLNAMLDKGITPIIILSDFYGTKSITNPGWISPLEDPTRYTGFIDTIYNEFGTSVIYDVWNEPDSTNYWPDSREEFFAVVKLAYDHLRSKLNGNKAILTAPSTELVPINFFRALLQYCSDNNIVINYFNFHYFTGGPIETGLMVDTIQNVRELAASFPKVKVEKVIIPELISDIEMYIPAENILQFKRMEEAGVEGTCRACWKEKRGQPDEVNNCHNNSLNGLLTHDTKLPRASFWAQKYYAESLNKRLPSISHNDAIVAIPYLNEAEDEIKVIIASVFLGTIKDLDLTVRGMESSAYPSGTTLTVQTRIIPYIGDGRGHVDSVPVVNSEFYNTQNTGLLRIRIPEILTKVVYVLTIKKP